MTHIVNFPTKKAFIEKGLQTFLIDPSAFDPFSGTVEQVFIEMEKRGKCVTVTNHPKRSWFAEVKRNAKGEIIIK